MKKLSKKELKRMNELYEEAVARYLDKTDFNVSDWLDEKESLEFTELITREDI